MSGAAKAGLAGVLALPLFVVVLVGGVGGPSSTVALPPPGKVSRDPGANIPAPYRKYVAQAAGMCSSSSEPLIAAQLDAESSWNPKASSGSADGIAQFTPATWTSWGGDYNNDGKRDVWDPADAIPSEGHYMCALFKMVKAAMDQNHVRRGSLLQNTIASYNMGEFALVQAGGFPTGTSETDAYVPKILKLMKKYTGSAPVASGPYGQASVAAARAQIGQTYITGGGDKNGPTGGGFDCSGLVLYAVYQGTKGKLLLPHYTGAMEADDRMPIIASGPAGVDMKAAMRKAGAQPGDILQYDVPNDPKPWGHVALVVNGEGRIIEAPHPGATVKELPTYNIYEWQLRRPLAKYTGSKNSAKNDAADWHGLPSVPSHFIAAVAALPADPSPGHRTTRGGRS